MHRPTMFENDAAQALRCMSRSHLEQFRVSDLAVPLIVWCFIENPRAPDAVASVLAKSA